MFDNSSPVITGKSVDTTLLPYKFKGEFSYLSNSFPDVENYESSVEIKKLFDRKKKNFLFTVEGKKFISSEQYYQYKKFLVIEPCYTSKIMSAVTSQDAKQFGEKEYFVDFLYDLYKQGGCFQN